MTSANIDDEGDKLKAYKCDVIYGSINELEGDVLRDEFLMINTRNNRPYDIVIIDEADSMMIDGKTQKTRLSSEAPGMSNLLPILINIWVEMQKSEMNIVHREDACYHRDETGKEMEIETSKFDFIATTLTEKIQPMITCNQIVPMITCDKLKGTKPIKNHEHTNKISEIQVPNHLYDFVIKNRLKVWIKSAYAAKYNLTQNREYLVLDGQIKIVDYSNTGIVHKNMKWTDGLQQFLQLKHDVLLMPEELTTNYLANSTFFKKYKEMFGVTGTLGCDLTKKFLKQSYNVDSFVIPTFKTKQHLTLQTVIEKTKNAWYKSIVGSCVSQVADGKACLIIAESIAESNKIREEMKYNSVNFPQENVIMYQTENDSNKIKREFCPGEVIITTNIAGRGVDIGMSFCYISQRAKLTDSFSSFLKISLIIKVFINFSLKLF